MKHVLCVVAVVVFAAFILAAEVKALEVGHCAQSPAIEKSAIDPRMPLIF